MVIGRTVGWLWALGEHIASEETQTACVSRDQAFYHEPPVIEEHREWASRLNLGVSESSDWSSAASLWGGAGPCRSSLADLRSPGLAWNTAFGFNECIALQLPCLVEWPLQPSGTHSRLSNDSKRHDTVKAVDMGIEETPDHVQ
jgi:hypothetical protein